MDHTMDKFVFGFDDNLGLPADFIGKTHLKTKSYHDIGSMVADFEAGKLTLMFIPAGTLLYIHTDYRLVAQASIGPDHKNRIKAKLVTAKNLKLADIRETALGRVNPYCTTSFWSAFIYLLRQSANGGPVRFVDTDSFEDMLGKTAEQQIDASLVWDVILNKYPAYAAKVHELALVEDLPTPVIIASEALPSALEESICHFQSADKGCFFNGFTKPDIPLINEFKENMRLANQHFNIGL
jgi:hypothetical protein